MALLEVSYYSEAMDRTVPMRVVSPADKVVDGYVNNPGKKFKMLLLMHGFHGSYVDWTNATRIQKWAETNNFMVVMPSGDNAFYIDSMIPGNAYGKMIGEEIPRVMRGMFPISDRREDMFIAGLSMGGFGALRNGLKYNETFGYIAAYSSGLNTFELPLDDPENGPHGKWVIGDVDAARETDKNPRWLAKDLMERHKADPSVPLPKIYMSCGTEDPLIRSNHIFRDYLIELGYDVTWFEGPGEHAWTFWDPQMQKVIAEFLPLSDEDSAEGLDSGHTAHTMAAEAAADEQK